ncbi:superfamily I DNA/RNA helicase [Leucobacter exalbidus]|uniref:DNA 3'-5' helicase n=1 Tax=Leucobacter exalbidus TaxID=662960 RepID=A0A940T2H6_9MICO|nr:UrvD/REP family ATP-dependent DNA helicase [Leucobacter exalbidus]MBP1324813.1 superfamily I DNA/RNA helicase [Leucobacter exalbidus]
MIEFDDSQQLVFALDAGLHASVLGAPGTGKTATLVESHVRALERDGWSEEDVLSLAPNRLSAGVLRQQIEERAHTAMGGTAARTAASLAFSILARGAALHGEDVPRLLTGTVQDEAIATLLDSEDARAMLGESAFPPEVLISPAFRGELRELWRVSDDYARDRGELAHEVLAAAARGAREAQSEAPDAGLAARWAAGLSLIDAVAAKLRADRPGELSSSGLLRAAAALVHAEGGVHDGARLRLPKLILVDDAQETGEGALALIAACAARGSSVWAFGDPDVSTAAFQGEASDLAVHPEHELVRRGGAGAQRDAQQRVVLATVHRHGALLRGLVADLSGRVGNRGAGQQRAAVPVAQRVTSQPTQQTNQSASQPGDPATNPPEAAPTTEQVRFTLAQSVTEQLGIVAHQLRTRRLGLDGGAPLDWSDMAVICRSRADAVRTSRALALHQVPTALAAGGLVLREHQLVRDLICLLRHALGETTIGPSEVLEIVGGPIGGLDPVARRRLRRELLISERRAAAAEGRAPSSIEECVFAAFQLPAGEPVVDSAGGRALRKVARVADAGKRVRTAGGTARETLWAVWDETKLAAKLQAEALDGRPARADEANRALDAVMGLFFALQRHEETDSAQPIAELLADIMENTLPEDSLARQSDRQMVTVTTPQGAIGREFGVVAVLGLQDGSWPNLRARGMLLGSVALERWLRGGPASTPSRRDTIHDELRLLTLCCARASDELLVVAIADEEQHPSAFFRFGEAHRQEGLPSARLTLRGATAQMRRELVRDPANDEALDTLSALTRAGVPGADPETWYGVAAASTQRPLIDLAGDPEATVPVSPSQLERVEQCPLNWAVAVLGGGSGNIASSIGTLVHHAFETVAEPDPDKLMAAVRSQWSKLPFDTEWESQRSERTAQAMVDGLAGYLREFASSDRELLGQEARFQTVIERALLRGSADRLEGRTLPDGTLEVTVLDLKTGRTLPTANETAEHAQLQAYQLGVALGAFALGHDAHHDDAVTVAPQDAAGVESGSDAAQEVPAEPATETALTPESDSAPESEPEVVTGGARLLYVHPDATKANAFVERAQAPITDEMKEAFMQRIANAAQVMAAGEFTARVEHHCSDQYKPGECQIHIIPAVSRA